MALVISLLVITVLSGAGLNLIIGRKGIIANAERNKMMTEIEQYKEDIETCVLEAKISTTNTYTIDSVKDYICEKIKNSNIEKIEDAFFKVTTQEGYVFIINGEKVEYVENNFDEFIRNLKSQD